MSESDEERHAGWRTEAESDGWNWSDPHWRQRVETSSALALTLEALRRAVDLRDACAESGEGKGLTARALFLVDVLNPLLERLVAERSVALNLTTITPTGLVIEIIQGLSDAGVLTSEEYRPTD
jgi:hypothetical protein